jgi:hypothetical protein
VFTASSLGKVHASEALDQTGWVRVWQLKLGSAVRCLLVATT